MNHFTNVHFLKDFSFSPLRKIDFQEKINVTGRIKFFPNNKRKEVIKDVDAGRAERAAKRGSETGYR